MQKQWLSDKRVYWIVVIINFLLVFIWCFYKSGLLYVICNYLFNASYRNIFSYELHGLNPDSSVFKVMKALINDYNWEFDYFLSESCVLFSLILPLTSSISGILLNQKSFSIFKYTVYRMKNRTLFFLYEAMKSSVNIALCFFIPMLIQYVFIYFLAKGNMFGNLGVNLFLDFFGKSFYFTHPYLYWLLVIVFRFFFCPFCYGMLSCGVGLLFDSVKSIICISNLYYYGLMIIGAYISPFLNNHSVYINPYYLLADGGSFYYTHYNTVLMIIIGAVIPLLIGFLVILFRNISLYS